MREVIASLDWIEPVTIVRPDNLGLDKSIRAGLDQLLATHDSVIVIEDDIAVAPEFYDYVCRALAQYAGDARVAGVTGLRVPFAARVFDGYPFDVFLSPRFSSWGWATWKDRWNGFSFDLASLRREIGAARAFKPERAGADMLWMVRGAVIDETLGGPPFDVVCATNMLLHGQYFVTPAWNMVENTGFVVGTHSNGTPPWELVWERDRRPHDGRVRFAPIEEYEPILREYLRFFKPGRLQAGVNRLVGAKKRLIG